MYYVYHILNLAEQSTGTGSIEIFENQIFSIENLGYRVLHCTRTHFACAVTGAGSNLPIRSTGRYSQFGIGICNIRGL